MKKVLLSLLLIFSLNIYSQEYDVIEEVVQDSDGKVVSVTSAKVYKYSDAEELLDLFYKHQFDLEVLEPLISYRMFEVTPYDRFKEMLQAKNNMCGAFIKKQIISVDSSENQLILIYELKVEYEKAKTLEKVYLVREKESNKFKVLKYLIQEDL
jgi:hypothetical protein